MPMSIHLSFRQKAMIITAIALVGWLAALYAVSSHIVMGRFARLERENVALNVQRARAALLAELDELDSKAGDWSTWDDAYAFMGGENPDFVARNVSEQNFIQLKIDLLAFVDTSNQVVFSMGYSDTTQKPIDFPQPLLRRLTHGDRLVQHADASSRHDGLLLLPDGIVLVASRPILNTQRNRPIRGTLVFGRLLESDEVRQLSRTTHSSLAFCVAGAANLPADVAAASRAISRPDNVVVQPLDRHRVAGYTIIRDLYGEPALWLRLEMPRDIYAQGRSTMNYFLVALLVVSVLFGTVTQGLLQKVVFHKLARKESEQRYRALVAQAVEGILLVDVETQRVLETNSSLQELLGHSGPELQEFALRDFALRDAATGDECSLECLMEKLSDLPVSGERQVRRKDGSWTCVELNANLVSSGSSRILSVVFHDISQRRKAEEELLLRDRAIEAIGQGIVITDPNQPDNPVIYVNTAFEKLTGYSRNEAVGRNCRFLRGPDTDPAAVETIRSAVRERRSCLAQLVNYRKDGTKFWNSLIVSPLADSQGRLIHFVGVQTDITAVKKLEEQLRQSQKMEAVGRLAGGVAHDFNNILTAMIGYCQLALDDLATDHPARSNVEEIAAAAERAASLTRQLLAFSRKQTLLPTVLDLNAVVGDLDKMLRRLIGEDIGLVTKLVPGLGSVRADRSQLEQVILNLAVNARDAMPRGGQLIIETAHATLDDHRARFHEDIKPGDYVMLAVTDTGSGMSDEVKARLFEPFFTTKPQGQGTGLGLATCYGVIKQSGGHINVYSELGRGTTFKVYLPRVTGRAEAMPTVPTVTTARGGSETILLVEDDSAVRALSARLLRAKGYAVIEANNGQEALRVASEQPDKRIALLLTDVIMPEMGGRDLAERFHAVRPDTKVLFCSGYTHEAIDRNGELEPGVAFLQKPFTPLALASKIREVLETGAPAPRS
jgi:PAS domain S-box-containing protein